MIADGCTSTNDTVILLASASPARLPTWPRSRRPWRPCASTSPRQMVGDAEGHTKVVHVHVTGAASDDEARIGARKVAESQLVKCSWYGKDPYWGRIASELGSAGIAFEPDTLSVRYGELVVAEGGVDAAGRRSRDRGLHGPGVPRGHRRPRPRRRQRARILTNDLTHAYVDENMGTS